MVSASNTTRNLRLSQCDFHVILPSHSYEAPLLMTAPYGKGKGPGMGDLCYRWARQTWTETRHSPVQLGVFHQRVGVPVTNEGPTREADEAFGVVLQLPRHLKERGGNPT